jgi:hypothetical protein
MTIAVEMAAPVLKIMDTRSFIAISNNTEFCFCISMMIKHFPFLNSVQVDINKG